LVSNRNSKDQGSQKKQNPTQAKNAEPLATADKSWLEEHRSSKDSNESMSTYNSNYSITEPAGKKEIIELEDSPQEDDDVQETLNLPPDNLVMADDVISGLNKDKEKIAQQYQYLMRNGGNQVPDNNFQMQAAEQAQQAAVWAQLMQLNQMYNPLQRNSMNSMGGGLPFFNMNPAMAMAMPYMYNNLKNSLLRQAQAQYPFLGNDVSSLLGKRNAPYEDLDSLISRNVQRGNPVSQGLQSEIIILDDEEEAKVTIPENKKEVKPGFWDRIAKDKSIKVFSIIKRPYWKKPVFKILTLKRRAQPSQFYEYVGKHSYTPSGSIKIGARERSALGLTKEMVAMTLSEDIEDGRRRSTRLRGDKLMERREFDASGYRRAEEINQSEPYVINVHINEDDPNEEITETPIGDDFQVALPAFSISSDSFRPVKAAWNPEMVEDIEALDGYYQTIGEKFEREVVNEEVALRTLRKFDMDVSKVIEEIEENKMTYRSFFEVKQKVPRSRVLHL